VDDSLIEGKYVQIGDTKYLALDSTPDEFSQKGVILNPDYVAKILGTSKGAASQLIPKKDRWANVLIPQAKILEDGKTPGPLSISLSGATLSWAAHSDRDIVGYRVYRLTGSHAAKVSSIRSGTSLAFSSGDGSYYVTAVDIAGKESAPSNIVQIGGTVPGTPDQNTTN
jgi:penicillin-binding protein